MTQPQLAFLAAGVDAATTYRNMFGVWACTVLPDGHEVRAAVQDFRADPADALTKLWAEMEAYASAQLWWDDPNLVDIL